MGRVVLTSFGSFGDVYPYIGLALRLRDQGHEPLLALPPAYRTAVEAEGLSFRPVRPDVDIRDRSLARRVMDPRRGTDVMFGEILIPSLPDSTADLHRAARGADLLVTHPATLAGPIVAEELGLPWASTALAPMSLFSVHDPVVPPPAPWLHALTSRSLMVSRWFRWQTERITRRWAEPVQAFRVGRGLPSGPNPVLDGQHSPHLGLGMFSRVLAHRQPDWPTAFRVTGAVLYNGPGPAELAPPLRDFLDRGDAPIVFTLGTSAVGAAGSFYDVSAEVARRLGRRAVLLAGPHRENRPQTVGDDVLVVDFAPHAALFPHAAAIVHQGGAGTLHQALHAGRPMLVVPHAHDQPDNARRVESLGVARTVSPARYRVARVENALRSLIEDPACAARALEVAEVVRAENGADAAARALGTLLA